MQHEDYTWPLAARQAIADVNNAIPAEWRISSELLSSYRPGSDVRPLAHVCGIMTAAELASTDPTCDAIETLRRIAAGEITSAALLTAYAKRAAIAHQAVCCLTAFFFDTALIRATELDRHLAQTGKPAGALHGLPISVKSSIDVKGQISSAGFSNYTVAKQHGHIVQILEDAGAIVFCKTNLPQAIMALESHSFWGRTLNPLNTLLSPGGSSGGCSALMAFGGSPLSLGSDIGGSLRGPAAACGLWSLKPTTQRLPRAGSFRINAGYDSIPAVIGPICRSLRDLELIYMTVLATSPWLSEHQLIPLPWRQEETYYAASRVRSGKLRVGVMSHDGVVKPHPPIECAIARLRRLLVADQRFEVFDYSPYEHAYGSHLAAALYYPDSGRRIRETALSAGDPLLPLTEWVISRPSVRAIDSVEQLWELNNARDEYRNAYASAWRQHSIDVLICPVAPQTAAPHDSSKYWGYTSIYNLVDFPAMSFPTGWTLEDLVSDDSETGLDGSSWSPVTFRNTSVSLQAVSYRYEDERLVEYVRAITSLLRAH